jgi:hypothetical protein
MWDELAAGMGGAIAVLIERIITYVYSGRRAGGYEGGVTEPGLVGSGPRSRWGSVGICRCIAMEKGRAIARPSGLSLPLGFPRSSPDPAPDWIKLRRSSGRDRGDGAEVG